MEFIPFDEWEEVRVLDEHVCGCKVAPIYAVVAGERCVLKEIRASFQADECVFMDRVKSFFGLNGLGASLVMSDHCMQRKELEVKRMRGNWKLVGGEMTQYLKMGWVDHLGSVQENKSLFADPKFVREVIRVRMFDAFFGTSDNNFTNILVEKGSFRVFSIDENHMFTRVACFTKKDSVEFVRRYKEVILEEASEIARIASEHCLDIARMCPARHVAAFYGRIYGFVRGIRAEIVGMGVVV